MAIKPMEPPKTEPPPPGVPVAGEAGGSMLFRTPEARAFLLGIGMFAPAVLYIALLIGVPFVLAFLYAFGDVKVGSVAYHFVGLDNFRTILESPSFKKALSN